MKYKCRSCLKTCDDIIEHIKKEQVQDQEEDTLDDKVDIFIKSTLPIYLLF